jgi:hypothetical protein
MVAVQPVVRIRESSLKEAFCKFAASGFREAEIDRLTAIVHRAEQVPEQ